MNSSNEGNIYLAYGMQSPESLNMAIRAMGPGIVFCQDTARMAGATVAAGTMQALADLRQRLAPSAIARQKRITPGLSDAANAWLSHGQRGLAADSVFQLLTGTPLIHESWMNGYPYHPKSVDDFQKCLQLLDAVPELQQRFHAEMGFASAAWAKLISNWSMLTDKVIQNGNMVAQVAILEALEGA
ncbi:hypothetical protein [Comamonas thiooxydans]|nr:hypothetical protein [Comamonas thiooxydans]